MKKQESTRLTVMTTTSRSLVLFVVNPSNTLSSPNVNITSVKSAPSPNTRKARGVMCVTNRPSECSTLPKILSRKSKNKIRRRKRQVKLKTRLPIMMMTMMNEYEAISVLKLKVTFLNLREQQKQQFDFIIHFLNFLKIGAN